MNIIINTRFLTQKLTGVQRFAIEIARQLKVLLPGVTFVAPSNIIHHQLATELEVVIIGKRTGVAWEQIDLPLHLKKSGHPFLINLCNVAPLFYNNQAITLHDVAFLVNPGWFSKNFIRFYKFLIPRIARRAKIIFTVSNFSKSEIVKYMEIDPQKIKVIYNGVTKLESPKYATIDYGRYILTVGSIDKRKNILNLIEAFKLIKDKNLKLLIVGDVNSIFNNQGNEMLKTEGNIIFTGRIDDAQLAGFYEKALMFVYPSLYEGFGLPPIEAMLYSCPTVVSDIPSLREICGDASLYVNPYDINDIAKRIELLIDDNDLREKLVEKSKHNIDRFSWELSAMEIANSVKYLIN